MCLATVYNQRMDNDRILCRNISKIEVDGDTIKLYDIMGNETVFEGRIVSAQLDAGVLVLAEKEVGR
ncbi:MAG TPA: CooT family nickel-binding protein [Clostridiales bacterium]|jgi:predicted RNA-binding protein|nr:CooT family nickel-binding protein [Clostridiales bacterium]